MTAAEVSNVSDQTDPGNVSVELYHGPVDTWENIRIGLAERMDYERASEEDGEHWFAGSIPCTKTGQYGVTVRILPKHEDLVNPYELGLIHWEVTK